MQSVMAVPFTVILGFVKHWFFYLSLYCMLRQQVEYTW